MDICDVMHAFMCGYVPVKKYIYFMFKLMHNVSLIYFVMV